MSDYKKITILVTQGQYDYLKNSLMGTSKLVRYLLAKFMEDEKK